MSAFGLRNSFELRASDFGFPRASAALPAGKTRPIFANSTDFPLKAEQASCPASVLSDTMSSCLNKLSSPIPGCLLRKGSRVFALLGKATPLGLAAFSREDVSRSWALTAEFGWLRLERLSGNEEVTGEQVFLPLPSDYRWRWLRDPPWPRPPESEGPFRTGPEHPTPNLRHRTTNGSAFGNHWMLGVGCWMFPSFAEAESISLREVIT